MLIDLADVVRNTTITADATQIAADTAAVAAIWSFGLSMAVFATLEATEIIKRAVISQKSGELNAKLKTVDTDISAKIGNKVHRYIVQYKANNNLIQSKSPKGLDTKKCRSLLMQFMAEVQKSTGNLDVASFKKYAESARRLYNSDEINKVYDALDDLNFSSKSDDDIQKFLGVIQGLDYPSTAMAIVRGISIAIMYYKLNIASNKIEANAQAAGFDAAEVEASTFEMLDAVGQFFTVVAVVMSVIDTVLEILDIVDVVEQTKQMCDKLNGPIKDNYKTYFGGIKTASQQYNAAITQAKSRYG
ncbi:uncharacterized protein FTJAE_10289 [Fusarium tjaetaba]|uniref:Uncharacterized protein n=1 Tax=Fusarium tjaetaba TaxID=1567544 RepID=A0A8H5R3D9_9HYPO|nr:uncharacterized protein FTJAE_10289 [Fusarium tjaetaba]KAF5624696.1 hypothetical protein FTJAE_10289 [Fusarium tjaetaba]